MESHFAIKKGPLLNLSVQQAIDCTQNMSNYGCDDGYTVNVLKYFLLNKVMLEQDYPFAGVAQNCRNDPTKGQFKLFSF